MTKVKIAGVALLGMLLASGCASTYPRGVILTEIKLPLAVTANSGKATKTGVAECKTYMGMIATGDVSLETAKRNGGITKVHHVDWEANSFLGIVSTYKLTVYGE